MTFQQTLDYLYDRLPVFQRIGSAAYKGNLDNTLELCRILENPQTKFKSVHVAGTNGKGSSSHLIAAVLQAAGYKTGLYTSPHLKEFTERIRINGREVSQQFVIDFVERMRPSLERISPSFFEATVAMAFDCFAEEQVDIAVIEVGLGGRLDSTNVITPLVSLITNIGYDHMDLLGETLPLIASEKAGIIKESVPVVISQRQPEVDAVFIEKAGEMHADIRFADKQYQVTMNGTRPGMYRVSKDGASYYSNLECELKGNYQVKNLAGVLAVVDALREQRFSISNDAVRAGIGKVVQLTGLKGRWQQLSDRPRVVCDTGHNVDGIREVVAQIRMQAYERLYIVLGTVNDKDIDGVLALLPKDAFYYFCQAKIPRALEAATLASRGEKFGLKGVVIPDVNDALEAARAAASVHDFIFVGGSTFVVADINGL